MVLTCIAKVGRTRRLMKRAPKSKLKKLNVLRARIDSLEIPGFYKLEPLQEQAAGLLYMNLGNIILYNDVRCNLGPEGSCGRF